MRSGTVSFVDIPAEMSTAKQYCPLCEETMNQYNKLVPRYVDGIKDDKFKVCGYCGELYPIHDVKYFTEYEPKGYIPDNPFDSGAKVEIQSRRRKVRKQHRNNPLPNEDVEIPKFAGQKDTFLEKKVMEEGAIITSIVDSWVEESE